MGKITYESLQGEDAAKLDELFGIKNCMIEVNPGKVLLPPEYRDCGERIFNLGIRPDDVWLVSYPRSGSTWTQEIVWLIGHDLDYEGAKVLQLVRTPVLEMTALMMAHYPEWMKELGDSVEMIDKMPSPRYIKTHLPLEILPQQIQTVHPKMIYVARNPKDMCVSYYHHFTLVHNMRSTFEDFSELFLKGKTPIGPVWNHVLGFWRRRNDPNVLFLKYEDMQKDIVSAIRRIAEFMGKDLNEEQIKALADYLSFSKMKTNPAVNFEPIIAKAHGPEYLEQNELRFIRKGKIGDYKNYMTPELINRFDKWTEENLRGTGLSFD